MSTLYINKAGSWDSCARRIAHAIQNAAVRVQVIEAAAEKAYKSGKKHVEVSDVELAIWDSPVLLITPLSSVPAPANGHTPVKLDGKLVEAVDRHGCPYQIRKDDAGNQYAWGLVNGGLFKYAVI